MTDTTETLMLDHIVGDLKTRLAGYENLMMQGECAIAQAESAHEFAQEIITAASQSSLDTIKAQLLVLDKLDGIVLTAFAKPMMPPIDSALSDCHGTA